MWFIDFFSRIQMINLDDQIHTKLLTSTKLIGRCTVSCVFVLITQFTLSIVPRFFSPSPLIIHLSLSGLVLLLVLGFGGWSRRLLGVHASAPAFVIFSLLFIWGVYLIVVRQAVSFVMDVAFNGAVVMLVVGLCSMLSMDPGVVVAYRSSALEELVGSSDSRVEAIDESSLLLMRVRYCKSCKAHIKGLDHHCPAFGNCIGQNNYFLFMVLLVGFISAEVFYIACSFHVARKFQIFNRNRFEISFAKNLAVSTMLFSLLQVLWQVVFLIWHIYCICFNIRTDEWINWKKYPEFHIVDQSSQGDSIGLRFRNPYDKGFVRNLKDFLQFEG